MCVRAAASLSDFMTAALKEALLQSSFSKRIVPAAGLRASLLLSWEQREFVTDSGSAGSSRLPDSRVGTRREAVNKRSSQTQPGPGCRRSAEKKLLHPETKQIY